MIGSMDGCLEECVGISEVSSLREEFPGWEPTPAGWLSVIGGMMSLSESL